MRSWCNPSMSDEREQVLDKIESELGKDSRLIVQILYDADDVLNLEEIEEALETEPMEFDAKTVRQILYALNDRGYARSRRHRDNETGWITFSWNLFPDKILDS